MLNRIRIIAAFAAALLFIVSPAFARDVTITFVQTGDIDRIDIGQDRGGFARLATVVAQERARGHALFVHSGDTLSPSVLSGLDGGRHIVDILNRMKLDVMTPGNHEFDAGPANFRARMAEATFDVVTSNVREVDGSQPKHTRDDKIIEVDGIRIGFFGLTTETTPVVSTPGDIRFLPALETARLKSAELRSRNVDLIVAVAHTALDIDIRLARERVADIVLSGHDEHLLTFYDGRTVLTESGAQASNVVLTTLHIEESKTDGKRTVSWRPSFRIVDTAEVAPDAEIGAVIAGHMERLNKELGIRIGSTATALDSRRATVRGGEAAIGNLIADAMREAVGADFAIANGGGIRADRQYTAGSELTRADILAEMPFGNRAVKLEVSGRQIRDALENGFSTAPEPGGRFPQISGMKVAVDLSLPRGKRVVRADIKDAPLDPDRLYTVATSDFLAGGGDGYRSLANARRLIDAADSRLVANVVIDYIVARQTVAPDRDGRITLLTQEHKAGDALIAGGR